MSIDDRYARDEAAMKIDGYYMPPQSADDVPVAFKKAKTELLMNMAKQMDRIEAMTADEFLKHRKG